MYQWCAPMWGKWVAWRNCDPVQWCLLYISYLQNYTLWIKCGKTLLNAYYSSFPSVSSCSLWSPIQAGCVLVSTFKLCKNHSKVTQYQLKSLVQPLLHSINVPTWEGTLAPPGEYDWTCASFSPRESTTQTANRWFSRFCTANGRKSLCFTMGDPFPKIAPSHGGIWTPI